MMRPNQPSPALPLIHTSFQPRPHNNTINVNDIDHHHHHHHYACNDCYSYSSAPTSPLSSTSTITTSSPVPTLPSSPTSPSLSPFLFHHIRNPRPIYEKLSLSHGHGHGHGHGYSHNSGHKNTIIRRRPSNIDTILRQERTRYDEDAVERQGLDLLEPRPVDLGPVGIDVHVCQAVTVTQARIPALVLGSAVRERDQNLNRLSSGSNQRRGPLSGELSQPRFVMGGIFEVMEGSG
ncbi:hypothetical protein BJX99DRAFT_234066 [Aspergillus californicus]